jgi:DNA-binding response OmpR family regulator/DNA-binding transcriptional LysR family regulator
VNDEEVTAGLDALAPRLRQFVAVAHEEHLTRAADLLGVPQPTLSRAIARLEAELGVPLFARPGRSVKLTRHGRLLLEGAERAVATLTGHLQLLADEADPARGRVALAFLHTLGTEAVPRMLRDFRAINPGIRFALVQGSADMLLTRLRAGEVDLCLTAPLPDQPDMVARSLDSQRIDLVVPAGHRLARRHGVRLAEAAAEDFICMKPGYGLRVITDELCHAAGFEPRIAFEGEEAATCQGLVGAGLGVSLLPATLGAVADPDVVALTITAPRAARTVGLVWMAERPLVPPVAAFRDFALGYRGRLLRASVLPWLYYYLPMTRVLLAEDDTSISEPLSRALRREGYQVEVTEDGPTTLGRALSDGIDLILLDIGLPELDGLEVCRRVRAEGHAVPVLILTARADEVDTVVGLDAGADDYVTKPFRLAELLARVRALLRRGTAEGPGTVRGVRVDADARRAWHGDVELDLTTKEFDLLWILLRDAGKVVTREQIMREVWDAKWWTSTKTLDMHISWLRRKLGDDAHNPRYITTVRGVGFRFERGD